MDTREQERTYRGFIAACKWTTAASVAVLSLMALALT